MSGVGTMPRLEFGELCVIPDEGCQRHGCGQPLSGQRKRWCSDECRTWFYENHRWTQAREVAMRRTQRRCVRCNAWAEEVDHIIERRGTPMAEHTCLHHQVNLRPLCHECHRTRRTWDAA
jgi:hypothetical protein